MARLDEWLDSRARPDFRGLRPATYTTPYQRPAFGSGSAPAQPRLRLRPLSRLSPSSGPGPDSSPGSGPGCGFPPAPTLGPPPCECRRLIMDPAASKGRPPDDVATEAFAKYDADGDGKLTKEECVELIAGLGLSVTRQYLDGVWTVYGRRRDAGPRGIP